MLSAYPAITAAEFRKAGSVLGHLYATTLEVSDWVDFESTAEEICIRRRSIELYEPSSRELELMKEGEPQELDEIEQQDEEFFQREHSDPSRDILVDYSIVLSPTYQVPVLWFSSPSIPATRADALDQIYQEVVSPTSRTELREIGVLGGISIAEHPISGLPAFFIHPCRTQEALEVVRPSEHIPPVAYMMLWFGIIGSSVGLSLPSAMAKSISMTDAAD